MSRSYCFVLNNYTFDEMAGIWDIMDMFRYICFGAEIAPTTGTPHLQGYFELFKPQRITFFKKTSLKRANLKTRYGTRDEARNYCLEDGDYFEWGNWEAGGQGTRNDLKGLMNMIKAKTPKLELMEAMPEVYSRNMRFVNEYKAELEKEESYTFRNVEVNVLFGDAGCGKTRKVHEEDPKCFTVNSGETFPFNNYEGEKTILIDDFYGDIKYHEMLRILDGHQYRVNVKGGHRYALWDKVYITSNKRPEEWYKIGLTPALKRRINTVTEFCNEEGGNTDTPSSNIITKLMKDYQERIDEVCDDIMRLDWD